MTRSRYLALAGAAVLLAGGVALAHVTTGRHLRPQSRRGLAAAGDLAPQINTAPPPGPAPAGMTWVPGGTFWMGCADCGMQDAEPLHLVRVDGFWMDQAPVTNAEFERFVRETNYLTIAERPLDPRQFPGVPADKLVPGSAVFVPPAQVASLDNPMQWWRYVNGASWRRPEGGEVLEGRANHPVVHVAWDDAVAYLKWAGKALPTEAQFEFAARGGLDRNRFAWGNDLHPQGPRAGEHLAGTLSGANTGTDGFRRHFPGERVPRQWLRPLRHGRERLAMVRRLVSAGLLQHAAADSRRTRKAPPTASIPPNLACPSASSAAGRSSAPRNTARATWSAAAARARWTAAARTSASAE